MSAISLEPKRKVNFFACWSFYTLALLEQVNCNKTRLGSNSINIASHRGI